MKMIVNNRDVRKIKQGSDEARKITNLLVVYTDLSGSPYITCGDDFGPLPIP